jgi:Zinc carboxypeptidase
MSPRLAVVVLLGVLAALTWNGRVHAAAPATSSASAAPHADTKPDSSAWLTPAQLAGYRTTPSYDETMAYCRRLVSASPWIKLTTYGVSGQGRDLPLMIVSRDRAFTPEAARRTGKPIVLIQNGIHSGEIEGKDACLELVRDLCVLKTHAALLDSTILIVLPIFSVDAHERSSPWNRINQNGPESMGWRTTPIGLNLNRDYLKVETPEMRALIGNVFTKWWPHLLIDDHTTDGADYRHDVTYGYNRGVGVPDGINRWIDEHFEGVVVPRLAAMGHLPAPYIEFRGDRPSTGIDFGLSTPRFSTGYAPLHGRPALLVETHMLKPYATRVHATYDLLLAVLEDLHAHPRALTGAVAAAEAEIVARGRDTDPAKRTFVLATKTSDRSVPFAFKGVETTWEKSPISGAMVPKYGTAPSDSVIPLFRDAVPTLTTKQPVGYLVPREWSVVKQKLDVHGVRYRTFARAWADTVEISRIIDWRAGDLANGHRSTLVQRDTLERRYRTFRAGDLWVPLDQRSAPVAVFLLESRSGDGLLYWNAFDTILEKKEYGEPYVLDSIAQRMLKNDPALKKDFETLLSQDSTFAKRPNERMDYFYRRSKWADPEQNLFPVARALKAPPSSVLAPVAEK